MMIKSLDNLQALIIVAKLNNKMLDKEQIIHEFSLCEDIDKQMLLRICKKVGLKAKIKDYSFDDLKHAKLPLLFETHHGKFNILAKITKGKLLVLDPGEPKPRLIEKKEFDESWKGTIILIKDKNIINQNVKFGLKWFLPSIIKYKKAFIDVLIAAFTLQLLGLVTPLIMQVVIDKVLVHKSFSTLNVLMIGLLIVVAFELMMSVAKNYIFSHTTNRIDVMLSARLFNHLMRLPLRYFEIRRTGETIARVREVENVRRFLTGTPLSTIIDLLFLFVYIIVMFIYSTKLTFIILLSIPFYTVLSVIITPIFKNRLEEQFRCGAENQSYLVEAVNGVQTIKSFALEPLTQNRWEDRVANYSNATFKTAILGGNASSIAQFIQRTTDIIVLWLGARLVMSGNISVGQLVGFRMLSGRVSGPILRLVRLWQDYQQTRVSIERLGDIFNTPTEVYADSSKMRLPSIKGSIALHGVTFRYRLDAPEAIKNLSLKIEAGKTIGIVGRSGSGKSTLSKVIQRLYTIESGKIMIDGVDLSLADPHWLRRQIGVVLQESFLFNGTVKENLCIHKPSANMEEIITVAKIAGAHDFILELPEGYDTGVGEKGTALSGGQKQRIAIARALLTNPRILIFDEATSALDYESETIIQKNLKYICKNRTVLIIAHRLSTIMGCDEIIVMERGCLAERGTHQQLLSKKGLYHYLFSQQENCEVM